MRSQGTRRVAQAAGAAMAAVIALAGCSAGQVAETALLKAPVSGLSTQSPDGALLIRNLQVVYNGPEGYPAGGSAPIEVSLFNQTQQPITVTITSRPPPGGVRRHRLRPAGSSPAAPRRARRAPIPEPSGSRPPANSGLPSEQVPETGPSVSAPPAQGESAQPPPAPAGQPARITIQPLSSATFLPGDRGGLRATGLSAKLAPGFSLSLTIQLEGSAAPIDVLAPFATPTSPASRGAAARARPRSNCHTTG